MDLNAMMVTALNCKGKPVICFDPDDLSQINQSDDEPDVSDSAEDIFHELCARVNSSVVEITKPANALCQTRKAQCYVIIYSPNNVFFSF